MDAPIPTDRARKYPVPGLGADTVVLRGPAQPDLIQQLPDRRYRQQCDDMTGEMTDVLRSGMTTVTVGDTDVRLYADRRNGGPEVRLEFSAPSILDGHNCDPFDLTMLPELVALALSVIGRDISGMPSYDQLRPIRFDIARDFPNVESPSRTMEAISRLPVSRARPDRIFRGRNAPVQTLMRGNTSRWLVRAYDKHEQMLSLAASEPWRRDLLLQAAEGLAGRLRVEVQFKAQLLRDKEINRVDDVDAHGMYEMAEKYFLQSRFGDVIGGSTRLRDVMTSLIDQGRGADARGVSAVLVADLAAFDPPMSRNTLSNYRTLTRRLGLTVADLTGGEAEPRRLDFWSGEELVGMDATKGHDEAP